MTNAKNYLKKKLFQEDKAELPLDEFAAFLFSSAGFSYIDEELKRSAASLRFFRDTEYEHWKAELAASAKTFNSEYLKNFYTKFQAYRQEQAAMHPSMQHFLDLVVKSDNSFYDPDDDQDTNTEDQEAWE